MHTEIPLPGFSNSEKDYAAIRELYRETFGVDAPDLAFSLHNYLQLYLDIEHEQMGYVCPTEGDEDE